MKFFDDLITRFSLKKNNIGLEKKSTETSLSYKRLTLMWFLIFFGYFVFVIQWYSIGNFSGGWAPAFYLQGELKSRELVASVPNWMITLGRAIGSILAGYWIARLGHRYAVVVVLSLMVIAFPYIIVAQNQGWNSLSTAGGVVKKDGISIAGFSLFVIFRLFLAIGGTTLISYTNSVIAKMPLDKRPKHMILNSFGFNGGAFFANIFFVIPGLRQAVNSNNAAWTSILSIFVLLSFVLLVAYLLFGLEVVPKLKKSETFDNKNNYTLIKAFKDKAGWSLYGIFIIWLLSVVFINSSSVRFFLQESPANAKFLANLNYTNNTNYTDINKAGYFWVWPAFICVFVSGYFVSLFKIANFSKSIFERKTYIVTMLFLGYLFMALAIVLLYFLGYGNHVALAFFLIFAFISGIFLWGIQPVILTVPQQLERSNPQFVGVLAGMIWGVGYLGYTIGDTLLSSIATYVGDKKFDSLVTMAMENLKSNNGIFSNDFKLYEKTGYIVFMVMFWVITFLIYPIVWSLPKSGFKKDGKFIIFDKKWNPFNIKHYNFDKKEYLISNQ